jgi:hypothetical protein
LSPANDYLYPIGFGLHHSGVEIMGREYSFGSGGSGIFEHAPRQAPGARFRVQLDMGSYDGGSPELNKALDDLRSSSGNSSFGGDDYNLIRKNCNHFCNALVWRLLRIQVPGYVNRLADLGNCCSCLLPKKLLEGEAPVGGSSGEQSSSSSFIVPTNASMSRGGGGGGSSAFFGTGHSLGGTSTTTTGSSGQSEGLLSSWTKSTHGKQSPDDLTDRRDKARMAALARLDRNHHQQQTTQN